MLYVAVPLLLSLALWALMPKLQGTVTLLYAVMSVQEVLIYLPSFFTAVLCAKYGVFERMKKKTENRNKVLLVGLSLAVIFCGLVLRTKPGAYLFEWLITVAIIAADLCLFRLCPVSCGILSFVGRRSIYYWLLSGFFFLNTSELQPILYLPQWTVLIVIWQLILETPFVLLFEWLSRQILVSIGALPKPADN